MCITKHMSISHEENLFSSCRNPRDLAFLVNVYPIPLILIACLLSFPRNQILLVQGLWDLPNQLPLSFTPYFLFLIKFTGFFDSYLEICPVCFLCKYFLIYPLCIGWFCTELHSFLPYHFTLFYFTWLSILCWHKLPLRY